MPIIWLFMFLVFSAWVVEPLHAADNPVPGAEVVQATSKVLDRHFTADGLVEAVHQATLRAKTSGTIVELNFDVNDFVEKESVLIRFRAQRNLSVAGQAEAGLAEARARMSEAESQFNRNKLLFDKKMVAAARMDEVKAFLNAARARLDAAKAQVTSANEGVSDTILKAPYSGYVVKRFVELGESAEVGQPLFSGMSLDQLRIKASIPQHFYNAVRQYAQVDVAIPDAETIRVEREALNFYSYAEKGGNDFGVRIRLPEGIDKLFPGMLVKVAFKVGEQKRLLVPVKSVMQRSELTAVYVQGAANHFSLRQVRTGLTYEQGQMVEILAGLEENEPVALDVVGAGRFLNRQPLSENQP